MRSWNQDLEKCKKTQNKMKDENFSWQRNKLAIGKQEYQNNNAN
jgi:hypothetical protein